MTFKLRILPRAEHDIQCIFEYIAGRTPEGSQRWWKAFQEAALRAQSHPVQYPFAPENSLSPYELRQFPFKTHRGRSYRAVFTIVGDELRLLRVRGPGQAPLSPDELSAN